MTASFYYRNSVGRLRRIEATEATPIGAGRRAFVMLERAMWSGAWGGYSVRTTLAEVAQQWLEEIAVSEHAGGSTRT